MICEIREICGDWALDVFCGYKVTICFNSRQNALNVKRILEVDDSIHNVSTVCDMKEVVRCKDCFYHADAKANEKGFLICPASGMEITDYDYCSYGERKVGE